MRKAAILIITIFFILSCGKKEVKQVTDESRIAQEAFSVAEAIKDAYLKRELSIIEKNSTREGYRELLGAIKAFDKAELVFSPKWVEIDKSIISLKIAWDGKWVIKGQTFEERGTGIFVFEERPLKLSKILRANPFRQPE